MSFIKLMNLHLSILIFIDESRLGIFLITVRLAKGVPFLKNLTKLNFYCFSYLIHSRSPTSIFHCLNYVTTIHFGMSFLCDHAYSTIKCPHTCNVDLIIDTCIQKFSSGNHQGYGEGCFPRYLFCLQ